MQNKKRKQKGFTMAELLITIFVFTVGILGVYLIVQRLYATVEYAKNRLIAIYLAQEGIEIVRNIRDTNYLEDEPWDNGIPKESNLGVDYTSHTLLSGQGDQFLRINNEGFYQYGGGAETQFKRKIKVTQIDANIIEVEVKVEWSDNFSPIVITEKLYNWRP